jgi:hypothetical protein
MFVPDASIANILGVTRDYARFKEFYRPYVAESKAISRSESQDKFSLRIVNKAFFLKNALDADYQSDMIYLDERRVYSVSKTTRVQEIDAYGQPGEHPMPPGEGSGYIWKLHAINRMEQRDEGVYVEFEAIALSRDIPAGLRFIVDPIVRRVSRSSLLTTLQQTSGAVRSHNAGISAPAGQFGRSQPKLTTGNR